ncbi:ABC-2 family transporter protein [Clostridium ragsdalei P11]|uniref:ABC-2 family transporter protein n=1 Tax=Clostridium ragsdalei P11 TaxID=1353534 RepID=A0A1A6AW66_9CLOT|nr:YhgE/Pip domain-containing protein [Clostridium ragsdalei]OBR94326.1 ABC-2 family transporter protein [Clostridium ragsdalei P11]
MKNIINIYVTDIVNIITNWVALVVVIALMVLPALYAWFNIKSLWNPYENTSGISVAIVNKDKGVKFNGSNINIGNSLVKNLKKNESMGWKFTNENDAANGVKYGSYYASITVPEDFSLKISSLLKSNPQKADLIYSVNEKLNAVAPKITEAGVTKIQQQITTTFVQTVDESIFSVFNRLGIDLTNSKPILQEFISIIFDIDSKIPEINQNIENVYNQASNLNDFISKIQNELPLIENTINTALNVVSSGEVFLTKARDSMTNLSPFIKSELTSIRDLNKTLEGLIYESITFINTDPKSAKTILTTVRDHYTSSISRINNIIDILNSLNKQDNTVLSNFTSTLNNIKNMMQSRIENINSLITAIDSGEQISLDALGNLKQGAASITVFLDNIINNYDTSLAPTVDNIMKSSIQVANNTLKILKDAKGDLPTAQNILKNTFSDTKIAVEDIDKIKKVLPGVENTIHNIASKLRSLDEDSKLNEFIKILGLNAKKEGDFIANPVNIKMNKIFSIPNYGSAMSPFFTTLSLWVGDLILVSMLSTEVKNTKIKNIKLNQIFLGRYLTFATISIFQALIVTLGDLFILKTYVANKYVFVLFAIFISIIFTMIIYTLVSVLGNVGKALVMILLVLQISASGGTFPIQVTPKFFQIINPLLPFTHAVAGMRETVGGIISSLLLKDALILLVYFFIFLITGLIWKRIFKNLVGKFSESFGKSGLSNE